MPIVQKMTRVFSPILRLFNIGRFVIVVLPKPIKGRYKQLPTFFKKTIAIVLSITIWTSTGGLLYLFGPFSQKAQAVWFDDNWAYRTPIAITNGSGGVLTDYQANFTLDTATLITNSKLQSSCQDIRVTDLNGKILPYWIDENNPGCNSATTKIWVKIPSIPTTGFTLYVYYGNPSAVAATDGNKVFAFFDGFNGSGLDTTKWSATVPASVSFASGAMTVTRGAVYTNKTVFSQPGYIVESKVKWNDLITARSGLTIADANYLTSGNGDAAYAVLLASGSKSETHTDYAPNNPCGTGLSLDAFAANDHQASYNSVVNNKTQYCDLATATSYILGFAINSTQTIFYKDRTSTNTYTGSWTAAAYLWLGAFTGATVVNTNIDDIVVDWVLVRQYAATEPTTVNGSEEKATAPIAYWKLDEGTGTSSSDSGTNSFTMSSAGTAPLPTWATEDLCVSGKCLQFNGGSGARYQKSYDAKFNITSNVTYNVWAKITQQNASTWPIILGRSDTHIGYGIRYEKSTNKVYFEWGKGNTACDGASGNYASINFTTTGIDSKWHMYTMTQDGTTISLYMDGVLATSTTTTPTFCSDATSAMYIGADVYGFEDEAKIYNYVRSSAQVLADYNARSNNEGVSAAFGSNAQNQPNALSQGLVGYWKMDESSGNASDSSGNGTTLTNNNTTAFASGKFGNAGSFTAASLHYFSTASTISGVKTATFWVNPSATTDEYINLTSSIYITSTSGTVSATGFTSPSIYVNGVLNGTITASAWNQVTITSDTAIAANQFEVGRANSSYVNGKIDEVRVYNRALSFADIQTLYNFAPGPFGYWKFDEKSGSAASDSSGNGGTANWNGTLGSQWTQGKFGGAGNFNGSDNYALGTVVLPGGTSSRTVSAWVKTTSINLEEIFSYGGNSGAQAFTVGVQGSSGIFVSAWSSPQYTVTATVNNGLWHFVTVSYDGTNAYTYLDGVLLDSRAFSINTRTTDVPVIGSRIVQPAELWTGQIDEVKFYNYTRTQKQVIEDMNAGHPTGGSPINTPVGFWKFDDGYGNGAAGAHNTGNCGSTCDGNLTNMASPATSTSGWTNSGRFGKALGFDGSNDSVTVPNTPALQLASSFSLDAWINITGYPSSGGDAAIIIKYHTSNDRHNYYMDITPTGKLYVGFNVGGTATYRDSGQSAGATLSTGQWYHVVGIFDDDANTLSTYVNGNLNSQATGITDTPYSAANNFLEIGASTGATVRYFNGYLDEVKIYAGALTPDQVKLDMNRNSSQVLGALTSANNTTTTPDTISGLKLWLKADSLGLSDGTAVSSWTDSSGTGNTATQATGANQPLYKTSIINGLPVVRFDGINDFMNTGTTGFPSGNSDVTMITVIMPSASGTGIVYAYGANTNNTTPFISVSSSTAVGISTFGTNSSVNLPKSYLSQPTLGTLKYTSSDSILRGYVRYPQVATNSSGVGAQNFSVAGATVGAFVGGPNTFLSGDVAEILVYNSALSDANRNLVESYLATKYNLSNANSTIGASSDGAYCLPSDTEACGSASTEFNFEEGSGTTTQDTTGNGNTGTLRNGPVFVQGKIGKGISFDGALSQDIAVTNEIGLGRNQDGSIEMWVKWSGTQDASCCSSFGNVFSRQNNNNYSNQVIGLSTNNPSTAKVTWQPYTSGAPVITGSTTVGNNTWRHIIITYSDGSHKLYIDGKLDGTATTTGTLNTGTNPAFLSSLGSWSGDGAGYCTCIMDKVRTFNYVLSPNQVAFEYSKGAPVVFYKFDDCQGTTINDSTGNSYSGTLAGTGAGTTTVGTCTTSSSMWGGASGNSTTNAGKINYALTFDGTDDNVQSAAISPLVATTLTTTKASWGGWFNPVTSVASKTLIEKAGEFQLITDASSIPICGIYTTSFQNSAAPPTALTLSSWNHVMCVYDGTNINTYLNGQLIKQSAQANNITGDATTKLYLGQTSAGANFYQGRMDEVKVYNYALNAAQVKNIYNNGALNFSPISGAP